MTFLKKNYGWIIVAILATLPLIPLSNFLELSFADGLSITPVATEAGGGRTSLEMLYHITGEFAIRWLTAVLTCTPFFILFGIHNLFVRQAMGIAAAAWSFLHFVFFIWAEGMLETFTQVNYVAGFVAVVILVPLFFTSNRRAMKWLGSNWKRLQRFSYAAVILSLLHVAILQKTWIIYAVIVGIGFLIRLPAVRQRIAVWRKRSAVTQ